LYSDGANSPALTDIRRVGVQSIPAPAFIMPRGIRGSGKKPNGHGREPLLANEDEREP
jgi:hypothetical protein